MTTTVAYYGPHEAVDVAGIGTVAHGDLIEVDDDVAVRLVEQGWTTADHADTVSAITDWVGEDPERAADALARENARGAPRKTLVTRLEALVATDLTDTVDIIPAVAGNQEV